MEPMEGLTPTSDEAPPLERPALLSSTSSSAAPTRSINAVPASCANTPTATPTAAAAAAVHAALEGFLQNDDPPLSKLLLEHLPADLNIDDALQLLQPAVTTAVDGLALPPLPPLSLEKDAAVALRCIQWQTCGRIWLWHQCPVASTGLVRRYVRRLSGPRTKKTMRRCGYSDSLFEAVVRADVVAALSRLALGLGPHDPPLAVVVRDTLHPLLRLPGTRRLRTSGHGRAWGEMDPSDVCYARLHQFLQTICNAFEIPLFVATDQESNDRTIEQVAAETKASAQRRKRQRHSRPSAAAPIHPSAHEKTTQPHDVAAALPLGSSAASSSCAWSTLLTQPSVVCRATPKGSNPLLPQPSRRSFVGNSHFRTNAAALWRQQVAVSVAVAPVAHHGKGAKAQRPSTSATLSARSRALVSEASVAESPLQPPSQQQPPQQKQYTLGGSTGGQQQRRRAVLSPLHNQPQFRRRILLSHPKLGLSSSSVPETPVVKHSTQQRERHNTGARTAAARPTFLRYD